MDETYIKGTSEKHVGVTRLNASMLKKKAIIPAFCLFNQHFTGHPGFQAHYSCGQPAISLFLTRNRLYQPNNMNN